MAEAKTISYTPAFIQLRQKRAQEASLLRDQVGEAEVDAPYALGKIWNVIFPKAFSQTPIVTFSIEFSLQEVEFHACLVSRNSAGFTWKLEHKPEEPNLEHPPWLTTKVRICWKAEIAH